MKISTRQRNSAAPLQIGYNLRFSESIQALKTAITSTSSNRLEISYHVNKPKIPLWALDSLFESFLLAIAVHPLTTAQYLFGDITRILEINNRTQGEAVFLEIQMEHVGQKISKVTISNTSLRFDLNINAFKDEKRILNLSSLFLVSRLSENGEPIELVYKQSPLKPINASSGYPQQFEKFIMDVRHTELATATDVQNSTWMYKLFETILIKARQ